MDDEQMKVDPLYKLDILLDTNVLVDYALGNKPNINNSLDFLADCPFVSLKSSHYVEFELTEVLKKYFFNKKVKGEFGDGNDLKYVKQNWKIDGKSYLTYYKDVKNEVQQCIDNLQEKLDFRFDELRLHEKLIEPVCELCLSTKISKEDCLVLMSSIYPITTEPLPYAFPILLTSDKQYGDAFNESRHGNTVGKIFKDRNINIPTFLNSRSISDRKFNLLGENIDIDNLKNGWCHVLLDLLKIKNNDTFLGKTYHFGKQGEAAKCLYIDCMGLKELPQHDMVVFISHDLTMIAYLNVSEYWCNQPITLPYTFSSSHKLSFKPENNTLTAEQLQKLREKGNLVFYVN